MSEDAKIDRFTSSQDEVCIFSSGFEELPLGRIVQDGAYAPAWRSPERAPHSDLAMRHKSLDFDGAISP
jgi:hypothetical protein